MLRAIHLFPKFSNAAEIDAIRFLHDPLASKIPPHITLVFPFESSLSAEELAAHAKATTGSAGRFRVSLGRPQARGEGFLWLPVVRGRHEVVALHEALYRGPLGIHLDHARPYEPHLTIARVQRSDFESAHQAAMALRGPFEADVVRLIIESIGPDESSSVESVLGL